MGSDQDWQGFVDLTERVLADEDLLVHVVSAVRSHVQESATLPVSDITGHTRVLLTAAARALAGRRAPTEAELTVVEQLAVTRARQGIAIEVVLGAVRISERAIWARTRELAEETGISAAHVLDARELYDDWADAVRTRLIRAHQEIPQQHGTWDRDAESLRRLLAGGAAATLAASERGFAPGSGLWVLVTRAGDPASTKVLRGLTEDSGPSIAATLDDTVIAVVPSRPALRARSYTQVLGMAGPVVAEELAMGQRLAVAAVRAAELAGLHGPVDICDVVVPAAIQSRPDLGAALATRHSAARADLGPAADSVALTVRTWLEVDRDASRAAGALYVHENTVRNRVQRFSQATGIDPHTTFGGVAAWWLCVAWMPVE